MHIYMDFPGDSVVKNPCVLHRFETRVKSRGRKVPLEKEMMTFTSIPAWEMPWREGPGGLQPRGHGRAGHDSATKRPHHPVCVELSDPAVCLTLTHCTSALLQ